MSSPNIWNDTGHDCKYCGDIILERDARYPSRFSNAHFRCRGCERQWSEDGTLIPSSADQRERPMRRPQFPGQGIPNAVPKWLWVTLGVIAVAFLATRFGIFGAVIGTSLSLVGRLLPLAILLMITVGLYRIGKHQGWW
ncbi:MAG: hypothetical protein KDE09_11025 [Anaerolineales bacterium]|nr:hypothetical protein [Anaerolineales bacterium]MCB0007167.1 hypothetical protein [Anaerolineales bacterium]MCB0018313.1 hypothetical protein [Anaerolineales bacterium]MCB0030390.1 hypothetical protein [Anaerolineales bacterium]MCB8960348.1 hypothetical protein [Ardenticatenales bacterium]